VRWAENSTCTGGRDVHPKFPSETIKERVGRDIDRTLIFKWIIIKLGVRMWRRNFLISSLALAA
jgi:hypothetical protein